MYCGDPESRTVLVSGPRPQIAPWSLLSQVWRAPPVVISDRSAELNFRVHNLLDCKASTAITLLGNEPFIPHKVLLSELSPSAVCTVPCIVHCGLCCE